jgi:tripartite-type tricarboxylate transporter receptor subunit TctC
MTLRSLLQRLLLGASVALFALPGFAQDPRPIRLVAPFAPGGAVDILARILADRLGPTYPQGIVVDNKPGASGHLGAALVAKAPGDGSTLLVGTIGIHAAYASYRKLTYDPANELQPIAILGESPNVVLVPLDSPYRTLGDLIADAKAHPGRITYATAGPGSSVHMVTALFELLAGVHMTHVPYKGSGPALVDLIGGQVAVMFDNLSSGLPQVQSGKLRALAVTGAKRDKRLPDVPTVAEAGVPGYSGTSWFTLAAPRSMPAPLVQRLNLEVQRAMTSPEASARLDKLGITYTHQTPEQAAAFFRTETVKWKRVIDAAKLQLD